MATGKLQEVLKQLESINPEELRQSMQGDHSPELAECLQSVRRKLEKILGTIIKIIEGDYRTAPLLPERTQNAIVPIEQATQTVPRQDEEELDAREKLKNLEGIKCSEYKQLLKGKFNLISAASMKLLRKMDKIFRGLQFLQSEYGPEWPCNIRPLILKIIEFLIDIIQEKPAGKNNQERSTQAEKLKPYIRYLLDKLSLLYGFWATTNKALEALPDTIEFLRFLTWLFCDRDIDSKIFDLECRGTDWPATIGFGAVKCPLPLFLASNYHYWQKNIDWGEDKNAIDKTKQILRNNLLTMLPKFQYMQKWLETVLSGKERRKQLFELIWELSPGQLEILDPDTCCRFFAFLEKPDAFKRFKSCNKKERVDFILAGEYTFSALGNVLSKNNSSANPP